MSADQEQDQNEEAYRRLKPLIDGRYPRGWFVAIDEGRIVADGETFAALEAALASQGRTSPEVLVVEAGDDLPDDMDILLQEVPR